MSDAGGDGQFDAVQESSNRAEKTMKDLGGTLLEAMNMLQGNMRELKAALDKAVHKAHDSETLVKLLKSQNQQLRQRLAALQTQQHVHNHR